MNPVKKIFVKKIELQEGLNDFDLEKAKKEITASLKDSGYKLKGATPDIHYVGCDVFAYWECIPAVVDDKTNSWPEAPDSND